jgi:hypothetical protein
VVKKLVLETDHGQKGEYFVDQSPFVLSSLLLHEDVSRWLGAWLPALERDVFR